MDKVKEKIVSLVPEIVELKEGCEILVGEPKLKHVIYGHDDDEGTWYGYLAKPFPKDLEANSYYDIGIDDEALHNVEILGRPIQLHDVLRAIHTKDMGEAYEFPILDLLGVGAHERKERLMSVVYRFNLATDYDGQTPEVKAFIGKLLSVTK